MVLPAALIGKLGGLGLKLLMAKLKDRLPTEAQDAIASAAAELSPENIEKDPEARQAVTEISEEFLTYYGTFEQLPKSVQIARAIQRPILTMMFSASYIGVTVYLVSTSAITGTAAMAAIGGPVGIIVGFLFGERAALKQS